MSGQRIVFLVRHAERMDFNAAGEWDTNWPEQATKLGLDWLDAPLTKNGSRQASHAATLIPPSIKRVFSSPFLRCLQTAKKVSDLHRVPLEISIDLTEWMNPEWFNDSHYRHFQATHFDGNIAQFAKGHPRIPENADDHDERWGMVFEGLMDLDDDTFPICLVSHGGGLHRLLNQYDKRIMSGKGVQFADVYRIVL